MKLRNILITVAAAGMMFASADRTGVIGYTENDYTDYHTFAHKAANYNVAYTAGDDFTAVWNVDGTTWGFSSGGNNELINMVWSNGKYGVSAGLNMPAGGDTTFDLGFGTELMGYDVGFSMDTAENGPMSLNARGKCNLWLFDTMTFGYHAATTDAGTDYTQLNIGMYKVNAVGANTNFMFGMGVGTDDMPNDNWVDPATLVKTKNLDVKIINLKSLQESNVFNFKKNTSYLSLNDNLEVIIDNDKQFLLSKKDGMYLPKNCSFKIKNLNNYDANIIFCIGI